MMYVNGVRRYVVKSRHASIDLNSYYVAPTTNSLVLLFTVLYTFICRSVVFFYNIIINYSNIFLKYYVSIKNINKAL